MLFLPYVLVVALVGAIARVAGSLPGLRHSAQQSLHARYGFDAFGYAGRADSSEATWLKPPSAVPGSPVAWQALAHAGLVSE